MLDNKKSGIILLLEVLKDYSDEDHYLTQKQMIDKISSQYGIELERKSIAYSIEILTELGYDIKKGNHGGYALLSRDLDFSEVGFIIDALFSSKAISGKHANDIANKLNKNLSIYQRKSYNYIYKAKNINRSENKQLFFTIETIHEAIKQGKRVGFKYLTYDEKGEKIAKMDGFEYIVSPYYLVNSNSFYYLICNYREKYHKIQVFRLDKIIDIKIKEDWNIKPIIEVAPNFKIDEYINEHIYLLGGETITATLEIENQNGVGEILDWFNKNAKISQINGKIIAKVTSNEKALLYWIMQYGENVKVLSPQSLIDEIVKTAHKSFDKYIK